MTPPTCAYCGRGFADVRGCQYVAGDPRPMSYGSECHPLSLAPTCHDCRAPKGTEHHAYCLATECPQSCHRQFHPGLTCEEDRVLVTGGTAA